MTRVEPAGYVRAWLERARRAQAAIDAILADVEPPAPPWPIAGELTRLSRLADGQDVDVIDRMARARQELARQFTGGRLPSWPQLPVERRAALVLECCWWLRAAQVAGVLLVPTPAQLDDA